MSRMIARGGLTPAQLCDLLNYVLGLPRMRFPIRRAIHPCVVSTWPLKRTRKQAESWCEARLREDGYLPTPPRMSGRHAGAYLPRQLQPWVPPQYRRAA